jgi:hypothetical protein
MRETIFLWWRMHFYEPPAGARDPRPPYALGDAAVIGGAMIGLSVLSAVARWVIRGGRR